MESEKCGQGKKLLLLKYYGERKEEFKHARKIKYAYNNVLEDMIFLGFSDTTATSATLVAKMRTLVKAYKSTNDNERQTGASPCTIPYAVEMDEIFGGTSIVTNNHTMNFGTEPRTALAELRHECDSDILGETGFSVIEEWEVVQQCPPTDESYEAAALITTTPIRHQAAAHITPTPRRNQAAAVINPTPECSPAAVSITPTPEHSPATVLSANSPLGKTPRKRKSAKEHYLEEKLAIKRKSAEQKNNFFTQWQL